MDIYNFLNSNDIAEHCRSIGHAWTPFEMAVIIGISKRPMTERHAAWRELIANYPDMTTPEGSHHKSYPSLHEKIAEAIVCEEVYNANAFALFKTPEQGAVYTYAVIFKDGEDSYSQYQTIHTTFDRAFTEMKDSFEKDKAGRIRFVKSFTDDVNEDKGKIIAYFDYDGNLLDIDTRVSCKLYSKLFPDVSAKSSRMFTEDFYVIIPTPFKCGDILTYALDPKSHPFGYDKLYVLESIDHQDEETMERRKRYDGDISDMNAWGYGIDESGLVVRAEMWSYDRLEYYRGKLTDGQRMLYFVSKYLKKDVYLEQLLAVQSKILLQSASENISIGMYPEITLAAEYDLSSDENGKVIGCCCPDCSNQ